MLAEFTCMPDSIPSSMEIQPRPLPCSLVREKEKQAVLIPNKGEGVKG